MSDIDEIYTQFYRDINDWACWAYSSESLRKKNGKECGEKLHGIIGGYSVALVKIAVEDVQKKYQEKIRGME